MDSNGFRDRFEAALASAGIGLDGAREWDMRVLDEALFARVARRGLLGLGDAYVDGWWECDALDQFFDRCLRARLPEHFRRHPLVTVDCVCQRLVNLQGRTRARRNGEYHYDLGNDLFAAMLDRRMTYTCAYWDGAADLDTAQENKLDLVCRKIGLRPGDRVLDLGCGWGAFAIYAAERYGAEVVGVTVSGEQAELAYRRAQGLPVEIRLQDYREVDEPFDHVVSLGMFEHVGPKNHRSFMEVVARCLKPGGLCLLQTFATCESFPNTTRSEVMWITRRIFPGLVVPSLAQIGRALDGYFVTEDLHNFGVDYDPTLMAWCARFERAWPRLRARYGDRFYRLWRYYLLSAAGGFRSRRYQLWQLVLSKEGVRGGYRPARHLMRPAYATAETAGTVRTAAGVA